MAWGHPLFQRPSSQRQIPGIKGNDDDLDDALDGLATQKRSSLKAVGQPTAETGTRPPGKSRDKHPIADSGFGQAPVYL